MPSYGGKSATVMHDYAYSLADEINQNESTDTLSGASYRLEIVAATSGGGTLVFEPPPMVVT